MSADNWESAAGRVQNDDVLQKLQEFRSRLSRWPRVRRPASRMNLIRKCSKLLSVTHSKGVQQAAEQERRAEQENGEE